MSIYSKVVGSRPVQYVQPLVFIVLALVIATIPFTIWTITHPQEWLGSVSTVSTIDKTTIDILRRKFFYYAWKVMAPLLDPGEAEIKGPLLKKAYGVVLEIGPGVGTNIKYYERSRVKRLILVEPNRSMHSAIRRAAQQAGFSEADGSLTLLGSGGSASEDDVEALAAVGITDNTVDTISSIHILCGIPGPKEAIKFYYRLLKSDGQIIFFEHVKSEDKQIARYQTWLTDNIWRGLLDGCELNRPTGEWLLSDENDDTDDSATASGLELAPGRKVEGMKAGKWKQYRIEVPKEQPRLSTLPHVLGWAIKA